MAWWEGVTETRVLVAQGPSTSGKSAGYNFITSAPQNWEYLINTAFCPLHQFWVGVIGHPKRNTVYTDGGLQELHWFKQSYGSSFLGDYVCEGYNEERLQLITGDKTSCTEAGKNISVYDLNYPAFVDLKDLFSLPKHGFDVSLTQQQLLEEHDQQHTMEESLKTHVEFLHTLNIAGVSQHSLLFSKAAPVQGVEIEDEAGRFKGTSSMGYRHPQSSLERNVDGAQYAFNPKDVKKVHKNTSPDVREVEPSEHEIRERINRLSQIYSK
ncbi:hypothetical protein ACS0TY_000082 [Phlomoides rotata]